MPKSTGQRAHPQGTSARNRMVARQTRGVVRQAFEVYVPKNNS